MQNSVVYNVLIVDDSPARELLEVCACKGICARVAKSFSAAGRLLDSGLWHLVFVNNNINGDDSIELLNMIKADFPELPVVMISDADSSEMAVAAIQSGFSDFVAKPFNTKALSEIIDGYLPNHAAEVLDSGCSRADNHYYIVGVSEALKQTIELAKKVAATSAPVLINGESGTGKELIAHLVHNHSHRKAGPYIKVNCAALSESLLESELFGHEKGAFTGAITQRKGKFELAHGGTLLLDEITETPPAFQAQLLRVLEEQDLHRVGGDKNISVNVRVISTTNKDIFEEVRQGRFRADLYYRLAGICLLVEPLRQRTQDIAPLVWHFVNELCFETRRRITKLDPVMLEVFGNYNWPGNIRQLRNVIRTCLILGSGKVLRIADVSWLMDELQPVCRQQASKLSEMIGSRTLAEIEEHAIVATLKETSGNRTKAARVLGISDRTIREKMKKYNSRNILQNAS